MLLWPVNMLGSATTDRSWAGTFQRQTGQTVPFKVLQPCCQQRISCACMVVHRSGGFVGWVAAHSSNSNSTQCPIHTLPHPLKHLPHLTFVVKLLFPRDTVCHPVSAAAATGIVAGSAGRSGRGPCSGHTLSANVPVSRRSRGRRHPSKYGQ
jgi:hypothetical protein